MSRPATRRVLLVGWDAADWKTITPLLEAGKMPALQSLIERGVMGNLATLDPAFSPMLWTSIATGHTADRHGIVHFVQPTEDGTSARPVLGSSRKTKAIWNLLSQSGLRSNVVGWWPSHPAEPIRGAMVSNFFHPASAPAFEDWVAPPGTVHPPELEAELLSLRVHPAELTGAHIAPFVPRMEEVDQGSDRRLLQIAKMIADASSVHAAATHLMETTEWEFTAVYFDALDHFGHRFMRYHPPQLPGIPDRDFALYQGVIEAAYRFHDMMLERLLALAGEDTTVMLVSDHGFHSDHLRPIDIPRVPGGPALEHRPFGVFCLAGPGIREDQRVYGANLLHITPTLLTLFGLPVGRDMAAPPLLSVFETPPEVELIPSWEDVPDPDAPEPGERAVDPWSSQEAMRQLADLGYVDPAAGVGAVAAAQAARDSAFNLGRVYLSTGRAALAVPEFERAYDEEAPLPYYGFWLARAYARIGRLDDAASLAESLRTHEAQLGPTLEVLRADIAISQGRPDDALAILDAMGRSGPEALLQRGTALLALGRYADADGAFQAILDLDPDHARAHHGRAKAAIAEKRYTDAWNAALAAVSRLYTYPEAHFHLGVALTRLGWLERAEQAFRVAVQQQPAFPVAHRWLAKVHARQGHMEAAHRHLALANTPTPDPTA